MQKSLTTWFTSHANYDLAIANLLLTLVAFVDNFIIDEFSKQPVAGIGLQAIIL